MTSTVRKEFIFEKAPFKECHASTLERLPDGTFLAAWFGGSKEGNTDVSIWLARRAPTGSWSAPAMVARVREEPHWNPVLFVPADGVVRSMPFVARSAFTAFPFAARLAMIATPSAICLLSRGELDGRIGWI